MQEKILEAVNSALNQKEMEQQLQEQQEQISFLTEKNKELSVKFTTVCTFLFLISLFVVCKFLRSLSEDIRSEKNE